MAFTRYWAWLKAIVVETSLDAVDSEKQMFGAEQVRQKVKTEAGICEAVLPSKGL